jgi:thiol-disulfide isomerase/thioredoxin
MIKKGQGSPKMNRQLHTFSWGLVIILTVLFGAAYTAGATSRPSLSKIAPIDNHDIDAILQDQRHPALVAAMAAWCQPCIAELPILEKLHQKYRSKGLKVVGISLDFDTPNAMLPILKKHQVTFPVYWAGEPGIQKLKIRAIPLLMFIRKGNVVKKLVGAQSHQTIEKYTQEILK